MLESPLEWGRLAAPGQGGSTTGGENAVMKMVGGIGRCEGLIGRSQSSTGMIMPVWKAVKERKEKRAWQRAFSQMLSTKTGYLELTG
jgi:hypothetical protein